MNQDYEAEETEKCGHGQLRASFLACSRTKMSAYFYGQSSMAVTVMAV